MAKIARKPPWASNTPDGPLEIPDLHAYIDRRFATQFLAERAGRDEPMRALRDKIGKQIDSAVKNGALPSVDQEYQFGDFTAWARTKRKLAPSVFNLPSINKASIHIVMPALTASAFGYCIPLTLEDCQTALKQAYLELNDLRNENLQQNTTIAELTPYKDQAISRSQVAKTAGAKGGRPSKQ